MNEFERDWTSLSQSCVQNGRIQDGRIQDGCHHYVEWDWISLSQIESEWRESVFATWQNLRWKIFKVFAIIKIGSVWIQFDSESEFKDELPSVKSESGDELSEVWIFDGKMAESKIAEFKMAAIINLSENAWVKFSLCKMAESKMAEFKMTAIIKLSENEWVWVRLN